MLCIHPGFRINLCSYVLILYSVHFRYLTTSYGTGQDIDERIVEGKILNLSPFDFCMGCNIYALTYSPHSQPFA